MMKILQSLASNNIKNISENIYRLDNYERDKGQILDTIVSEKHKKALTDFTFKEEDLALVRIVDEKNFPINLEYFPLDERNCYQYIENPFKFILGWLSKEMGEPYKNANVGCDKKQIRFKGD